MTFTNRHGQIVGDNPQNADSSGNEDEKSIVEYLTDTPGVADVEKAELTGVDLDFAVKSTGVEMDSEAQQDYFPEACNEIDGLGQQDSSERFDVPTAGPATVPAVPEVAQAVLPKTEMAAHHNVRLRKQPEKYIPSMKGNKYAVALTQIVASQKESEDAMCMAQMSINLMNKGVHQNADVVGMVMAQLSLKAAIKKWGDEAKYAVTAEMKQLHWRNSYKPKHRGCIDKN